MDKEIATDVPRFVNILAFDCPFEDSILRLPAFPSVTSFSVAHEHMTITTKMRRFSLLHTKFQHLLTFYYCGRVSRVLHADFMAALPDLPLLKRLELRPIFDDTTNKLEKCYRPFDLVHVNTTTPNESKMVSVLPCKQKTSCCHFDCLFGSDVHSPFIDYVRSLVDKLPHIRLLVLLMNTQTHSCNVQSEYPFSIRTLCDHMALRKASCVVQSPRLAFFT